jgi:hypothetical protein
MSAATPARRARHRAAGPRPGQLSRRAFLARTGALATALGTLDILAQVAWVPARPAQAATQLPDIQFDLDAFIPPAQMIDGVQVRFPPVHTVFLTASLARDPSKTDQQRLSDALNTIETNYPYAAGGVMTHVAYGLPYFNRLPAGLGSLNLPRLLSNTNRFALEEAVASPTDVSPSNPGITKERFNVPVRIERNDMLFTLRGDDPSYLADVVSWLGGSDRLVGRPIDSPRLDAGLNFTSSRAMFVQMGLPRYLAAREGFPYAFMVNPRSPMWMGFVDQQTSASAAAPTVTFKGANGVRLTTATAGDYFDNGSIQHLAHTILDLRQFYDVDDAGNPGHDAQFTQRVQYMFGSTPIASQGNADQFRDGGGPAFLPVPFNGTGDAARGAQGIGTPGGEHRLGHIATLQRSSRTSDGRPIHQRIDGPGLDNLDVPGGSVQPKVEFSVFVPTADFFSTMRRNQAALDLAQQFEVEEAENGLERFLTATRRQNFLIPPRRHRAFPLLELA